MKIGEFITGVALAAFMISLCTIETASPVTTGDAEPKSIKINLNIQEWKVK